MRENNDIPRAQLQIMQESVTSLLLISSHEILTLAYLILMFKVEGLFASEDPLKRKPKAALGTAVPSERAEAGRAGSPGSSPRQQWFTASRAQAPTPRLLPREARLQPVWTLPGAPKDCSSFRIDYQQGQWDLEQELRQTLLPSLP